MERATRILYTRGALIQGKLGLFGGYRLQKEDGTTGGAAGWTDMADRLFVFVRKWSEKFSASTIGGNTKGKIFFLS
jgi:hypothetical protein